MAVPGLDASVQPQTMPGRVRCARSMVAVQSGAGAQSASRKQMTDAPWRRAQATPALRAHAGPQLASRRSVTSCAARGPCRQTRAGGRGEEARARARARPRRWRQLGRGAASGAAAPRARARPEADRQAQRRRHPQARPSSAGTGCQRFFVSCNRQQASADAISSR